MSNPVLDTADWELPVPLKVPQNLDGARLTATLTGQWGGPAVAVVDSADGSIAWTADPTTRLTDRLTIRVPWAARGSWLAVGLNGSPSLVTVYFDVERTVAGSTRRDPLGRSFVSVYPATDSPAVLASGGGFRAVLTALPGASALLPALQTGPQGPPGRDGDQVLTLTAASVIPGHRVVRGVPAGVATCSVAALADADTALGIAEGAAATGAAVTVRYAGLLSDTTWSWTPGPVFAGLDGLLTQSPPRAAFEQRVGTAISATQLVVEIEPAFIFAT